jgi:hypothetical protein
MSRQDNVKARHVEESEYDPNEEHFVDPPGHGNNRTQKISNQQYGPNQQPFGEPNQDIKQPFGEPNQDIKQPFGEPNQDIKQPFGEPNQDIKQPSGESDTKHMANGEGMNGEGMDAEGTSTDNLPETSHQSPSAPPFEESHQSPSAPPFEESRPSPSAPPFERSKRNMRISPLELFPNQRDDISPFPHVAHSAMASAPLLSTMINRSDVVGPGTSPFTSPNDAIYDANQHFKKQDLDHKKSIDRHKEVLEKSRHIEREAIMLQKFIYKNANPDAYIVCVGVILMLALIWLVYYVYVRDNVNGAWYDARGTPYQITQNTLLNSIQCTTNGSEITGRINGNLVVIGGHAGLWDGQNTIVMGDLVLTRPVN